VAIGPWQGTFPWRRVTGRVKVPPHAREGIVNMGLLGGTGEVSFDDVQIHPAKATKEGGGSPLDRESSATPGVKH
jgi:hypothetical protein